MTEENKGIVPENEEEKDDNQEVPEPLKQKEGETPEDYQTRLIKTAKDNYARAKKAEAGTKVEKKPEETVKPEAKTEISIDSVLALQEQGFKPGDIRKLKQEADGLGIDIDKLVSNETYISGFKSKIDAETKKDEFDNKTPSSRGRAVSIADIGKKPLKEMSKDEKQAAFEKKFKK